MHLHNSWEELIETLKLEFSDSLDLATCLFLILGFMANECSNDNVQVEESVRKSFLNYLGHYAPQVFEQIFD